MPAHGQTQIMLLITVAYLTNIVFFSGLYFFLSGYCGLDLDVYPKAFLFSVETLATIGYGLLALCSVGCDIYRQPLV
jgi:hypothetical protein